MTTATLTATALAIILLGFAALYLYLRHQPKRVVLVVLKDGTTIRGALLSHRRLIVLGGAELLEAGQAQPIDGRTYIDRGNVQWVQEPGS